MLAPIVFYFVVLAPQARRASRDYLARLGRPHGFRAVYAHFLRFAHVTLDRLFFALGKHRAFTITRTGKEHLIALKQERRGALLLGAHLGSFEAMRALASDSAHRSNIVGYFKNARLINGVLQKLNPGLAARVINVERNMSFVLTLKERIDAGEMVAVLGDRVGLGERVVEVDLFGAPALLPAGSLLAGGDAALPGVSDLRPLPRTESLRPLLRAVRRPHRAARAATGKRGARLGAALRAATGALLPAGPRQLVQLLPCLEGGRVSRPGEIATVVFGAQAADAGTESATSRRDGRAPP